MTFTLVQSAAMTLTLADFLNVMIMVWIWHSNNYYSNWHKRSRDFVFVAVNL